MTHRNTLKVATAAAALALSLAFHGALPLLGRLVKAPSAIATLELVAYAPPQLLPVADDDKEGPAADPEPEGEKTDAERDAPSGEDTAVEEEPAPAPAPVAEEPEQVAEQAPEPAVAPAAAEPPVPERPRSAARPPRNLDDLKRLQRDRLAETAAKLKQRIAHRGKGKKHGARRGKRGRGGGEGGGKARAEAKQGELDPVYACTADGLGKKVDIRFQRPVEDWVTVVPTVLLPFDARPSLGEYIGAVTQVVSRRRGGVDRAGPVEFAIPAEVLQMEIEAPVKVRAAIGHLDGRCLVGLRYTKELFPMTLTRVPMRLIDQGGHVAKALVDISFDRDASFKIDVVEGELPFTAGRLKNGAAIAANIEQHYAVARAFKEVAGWFGVDIAKMARERREAEAKARLEAQRGDVKKRDKVARER